MVSISFAKGLGVGIAVEGTVDLQKVLDRIRKQRDEKTKEASRTEAKLDNADFRAKAPPEVMAEHKQRLHLLRQEQEWLTSSESQIMEMMK